MYADSDDSSDDDYLVNKITLGINLQDLKGYSASKMPENGSEYLYRVFDERKNCKKVVSVDIKSLPVKIDNVVPPKEIIQKDVHRLKIPQEYLPAEEWCDTVLKEFSEIRSHLYAKSLAALSNTKFTPPEHFPTFNDFDNYTTRDWQIFCFGTDYETLLKNDSKKRDFNLDKFLDSFYYNSSNLANGHQINSEDKIKRVYNYRPLFQTVLRIPQHNLEQLLNLHVSWLETYGLFNFRQAEWFYGICAVIEKPLDSDTEANLRDMARNCLELRSKFINKIMQKKESETENNQGENEQDQNLDITEAKTDVDIVYDESKFFDFITNLNLISFIAIVYFTQNDLKNILYDL